MRHFLSSFIGHLRRITKELQRGIRQRRVDETKETMTKLEHHMETRNAPYSTRLRIGKCTPLDDTPRTETQQGRTDAATTRYPTVCSRIAKVPALVKFKS